MADTSANPRYTLAELAQPAAKIRCPQCSQEARMPWCQQEAKCGKCPAYLHHPEARLDQFKVEAEKAQLASRKYLPDLLEYLRKTVGTVAADQVGLGIVVKIGGKEAWPVLLDMLKTFKFHSPSNNQYQEVPGFRDDLALALGKLGCKEAIPAIMEFLVSRQDDLTFGRKAIVALGRLRSREAIDLLIEIALNVPSSKGYEAARALRHIDPDAAIPSFAKALETCDKGPYDMMLDTIFTRLRILDTPEARRLTTRSPLDKLLFRRRWLSRLESKFDADSTLLKDYDDDD